ncbi:hypothetical protein N7530_012201, partial [Penicillium desertorum]
SLARRILKDKEHGIHRRVILTGALLKGTRDTFSPTGYGAWIKSSTQQVKSDYTLLLDPDQTTAGGIPVWVLRKKAVIRPDDPQYLNATARYLSTPGQIIERTQISHGDPVIMVQPENEYST